MSIVILKTNFVALLEDLMVFLLDCQENLFSNDMEAATTNAYQAQHLQMRCLRALHELEEL